MNKFTDNVETKPGERIVVDTISPFTKNLGGRQYWIKIVDD